MPRFKRMFWTLLALAFLGVSWVWDSLRPPIQWVIDRIPLEGLKRAVASFLSKLSPYPTLAFFLIPILALEPFKLVAIWSASHRQWLLAVAIYFGTDVLRLGLVSFLFDVSQEKLLSIGWFRRLYEIFRSAHSWAREQVEPFKFAALQALRDAGLAGKHGALGRKILVLWRHARRGGFKDA